MNDSELRQLADAAAQVLRPHLERSEVLRRTVSLIGQWLCEQAACMDAGRGSQGEPVAAAEITINAAGAAPRGEEPGPRARVVVDAPTDSAVAVPPPLPESSALVPLKLGGAISHVLLSGTTEEIGRARLAAIEPKIEIGATFAGIAERPEIDLALVRERCRLKAESCRLFIEKRAAGAASDAEYEARQRMNGLLARAKAMEGCFLWVFWRERTPPDDAALARIAESYDAHADAAALMLRIDDAGGGSRSDEESAALRLLAEANSALRVALADTWLTEDDRDQEETHLWLRRETASRRVFIERYMTADDRADPSNAADLRERIRQIGGRLDGRVDRAKALKSALGQIKYHAGQVVKGGQGESPDHWAKIAQAVARLTDMGIAATDRRIAEAVGPEAAALWAEGSSDARDLSAIVGRAKSLADGAGDSDEDGTAPERREWSELVLEVRALLRGKRMVVIGGERNARAVERLARAFELKEAEWVVLSEHGSGLPMRAPIHRSDTAVVVAIIKLTGHLHAEEARGYADAAGKPCILLAGGYNPERVAKAIMDQASSRLRG